ncbi:monomeric sarcosine oxidase-like isoform X2 [Asterias rubens]|uniref:monomeric sarcosine oxidase-like isoform X2 n=1 Tax=Asterias rubens TaxID=7604 RepID=UPI001455DA51|nr:monomeric sarcosine oxidase-like isoform X2 [Asterias rubens]
MWRHWKWNTVLAGQESWSTRYNYIGKEYVSLCKGAFECWADLEKESGLPLVYKTGDVSFAEKNTEQERYLARMKETMDSYGIRCDCLDGERLNDRFPQFTRNPNCKALYFPDNGVIDADLANAAHIQLARKYGASIREGVRVTAIRKTGHVILVETSHGVFGCRKVIVTAGAWVNHVVKSVGLELPLLTTKEQVTYFGTPNIKDFTKGNFPCWSYYSPKGTTFYGLPIHGNSGSKAGIDAVGDLVNPDTRNYTPNRKNLDKCIRMLQKHIPKSLGPIIQTKTCLYTMTPDRHFVIDTCHRTGFPEVLVCCGAGHAFKFASVFGKILTDLVTDGQTTFDLKPFTLDRPALTDPTFEPQVNISKFEKRTQTNEISKL